MRQHKEPVDPLVLNRQVGERVTPSTLGIYQLKRLALSNLLSLGVDAATIESIIGHMTPATIMKYAHTNKARQPIALRAFVGGIVKADNINGIPKVFPVLA